MPQPGIAGDWRDPPTEGARSAGETSLRLRVVIEPEQCSLSYRGTQAVVALEVVRQDSPRLVAEQSGRHDGVSGGGEVEALVSVDRVGRHTGRILNINLTITHMATNVAFLTLTQPSSNVAPEVKSPPPPPCLLSRVTAERRLRNPLVDLRKQRLE